MDTINWHTFLFLFSASFACVFAIAAVFTNNIVRMAVYLVATLTAVSGLFFLAAADFVGATQLMLYVGGTVVLIIFGVMLTAGGPFSSLQSGGAQWLLAVLAGAGLFAVLLQAVLSVSDWSSRPAQVPKIVVSQPNSATIGSALLGVRTDKPTQPDPQLQKGMSGYLLAFEVISVHLVVVLVGAAYLARARRRARHAPTA